MNSEAIREAEKLRDVLCALNGRIVLAESCTAGRIAATLGSLPGISKWMCGSFVVYRNDSKTRWLGIPSGILDDPDVGPVSEQVTGLLALAALEATPEAEVSLAVTGEIGPGAPVGSDGLCYWAVARRQHGILQEASLLLRRPAPESLTDIARRTDRLDEATCQILKCVTNRLARLRAAGS